MEDEVLGKDLANIVSNGYGVLDVDEGFYYLAFMEGEALVRFESGLRTFEKTNTNLILISKSSC